MSRRSPNPPAVASKSAALVHARGSDRRRRILGRIAATGLLLALVVAIGIHLAHKNSEKNEAAGPTPGVAAADGSIRIGPADAKVVVGATEDFQCPSCRQFEAISGPTLAELARGAAAVDYRPIAILNRMSSTNYSTRAASAAYCVAEADITRWPAWHTAMFEQQPAEGGDGLPDDRLVEIARSAGIAGDDVSDCITSHRYANYVDANTKKATASGIEHTPTVTVDGAAVGSPSPDSLRSAVAAAAG